jgi:hypothetical protein
MGTVVVDAHWKPTDGAKYLRVKAEDGELMIATVNQPGDGNPQCYHSTSSRKAGSNVTRKSICSKQVKKLWDCENVHQKRDTAQCQETVDGSTFEAKYDGAKARDMSA